VVVVDGDNNIKNFKYLNELQSRYKNFNLIIIAENVGYAKANNIAAQRASGAFLLFINSDVLPNQDSIEKLGQYLMNNASVGVVQGLLIYPQSGLVQSTGHVFSKFFNNHALEGRNPNDEIVKQIQERQGLTSAFYMTRNTLFKQMGGFDEFYFNAWEGLDYTLKVRFLGLKCIYYPEAKAYHIRGGARRFVSVYEHHQTGYFWSRWGSKLSDDLIPLIQKQLPKSSEAAKYLVINCSIITIMDSFIKDLGINSTEIISIRDRFGGKVDFYMNLSYAIKSFGGQILFVTNSFWDIAGNKRWILDRSEKNDLVIDLRGNVMLLKDLG
jgi:GT2 family glycosyltransferase